MSRQSGNGIAYFPLDVTIFNTFKIKALRKKCGPIAELALIKIYTAIYGEEGYYMVFDEDAFEILQDELALDTPDELKNMLETMVQKGLLSYAFLEEDNAFPFIVTSHGVQLQFQKSIKNNRKQQEVDPNIWILSENETIKNIISNNRSTYDYISFNNNSSNERMFKNEVDARKKESLSQRVSDKGEPVKDEANQSQPAVELNKSEGGTKAPDGELKPTEGDQSSPKFNSVKIKEKENKVKENKVNINTDIPKDPKVNSADTSNNDCVCGEEAKPKKKREPPKNKPKNNYGKVVSDFKNKKVYGEFENVWLTDRELELLGKKCPGYGDDVVKELSRYKEQEGKGYRSDYAAITRWVINAVDKRREEQRNRKGNRKSQKQEVSPDRIADADKYQEEVFKNWRKNLDDSQESLEFSFGSQKLECSP